MASASPSKLRRAFRIFAGVSLALGALLLIAGAALLGALANLDSPAIKARLVSAAAKSGLALDFEAAQVSLTHLRLTRLRIEQPAPDERLEPLLAVERVELSYSPWMALAGGSFQLREGAIEGVRATIYSDQDGQSSITRLLAKLPKEKLEAGPAPEKKPQPLSETLDDLSNLKLAIGQFVVRDVSARLVDRIAAGPEKSAEVRRLELDGLELRVSDQEGALDVTLATPEAGGRAQITEVDAKRTPAKPVKREAVLDARAHLRWSRKHEEPGGSLEASLTLRRQDLLALPEQAPAVARVLELAARVTPEPAHSRTRLVVDQLDLLEGAGKGHLDCELVDDGHGGALPSIKEAVFELVLERVRPFIPTQAGELSALSGGATVRIFGVDLHRGLRVAPGGRAEVRAEIPRLAWKQGEQSAEVERALLELTAKPAGQAVAIQLDAPLEKVHLKVKDQSLLLEHARLKADATAPLSGDELSGAISGALGALRAEGPSALALDGASWKLQLEGVRPGDGPLGVEGKLDVEAALGALSTRAGARTITLASAKLRAPITLAPGAASGAAGLHAELSQLAARQGSRTLLAPSDLSLELSVPSFDYDAKNALASSAQLKLEAALGAVRSTITLDKKPREANWSLSLDAPSLAVAAPLARDPRVAFGQLGAQLTSEGKVSKLGEGNAQLIEEKSALTLSKLAIHGDDLDAAFNKISIALESKGTLLQHQLKAQLAMSGISLQNEARAGDETLALQAKLDRTSPKLELDLQASGEPGPLGHLSLRAGYERAKSEVSYAIEGELHKLDLLPALLPPQALAHTDLEWEQLAMSVQGQGTLAGLVTAMHDLKPSLSAKPLETIRGAQTLAFTLRGLDYSNDDDQAVVLSEAKLALDAKEEAGEKRLDLEVSSPQGEVDASGTQAKFESFAAALHLALQREGLEGRLHLGFASLKQDAQPGYPVGDAALDAQVSAGADGTLRLESVKLDNPAGGTTLNASGVIEALLDYANGAPKLRPVSLGEAAEQRDLKLSGELLQRLEALPAGIGFTGRGEVRVPFSAESSDFRYFQLLTGLELKGADIETQQPKLALRGLNAKIPVRLHFRLDESGALPLGGARPGVYSRERFVDYQPYLGSEDFISCEELQFGESVLGPLAANLRVDRNVIALDQLELAAFGGKITGQFLMDLDLAQRELTDVQFRGDVTGLAPGKGEERSSDVVDANAALRLNPKRLELEGRVDIVRIGRDDLRGMLDVWDPEHADEQANLSRKALLAGYPKEVRLGFHQGFTEISMEMGGLGGLARLAPIQRPTGPILQQYVAPYLLLLKPKKSSTPPPAPPAAKESLNP